MMSWDAAAQVMTLEANLGPLPLDKYNMINGVTIPRCQSTYTIRACVIIALRSYASQNVTGVRFMFGVTGGGDSTALNSSGTINPEWDSNIHMFLDDVKASGIINVTPSPNWGGWGGDFPTSLEVFDECQNKRVVLAFFPALPYGLEPYGSPLGSYYPADQGNNSAYRCSPKNPIFLGWPPIYSMLEKLVSTIKYEGLMLQELDLSNEINLLDFTVMGRQLYDISATSGPPAKGDETDVLGNVRSIVAKYDFDPAAVTYSVNALSASSLSFDCMNAWGDSARLSRLSALYAAFEGPQSGFGYSPTFYQFFNHGLVCDVGHLVLPEMASLPVTYRPAPVKFDLHDYSCILIPRAGGQPSGQCNMSTSDMNETKDEQTLFTALRHFCETHMLSDPEIIIGETFSNDIQGSGNAVGPFGVVPLNIVPDKLVGLINELLNVGALIVRPWGNLVSGDFSLPQDLTTNFVRVSQVLGNIDKVYQLEDGSGVIRGWACSSRLPTPISVTLYFGGPMGSGHGWGTYNADAASEFGVGQACDDNSNSPHGFQIIVEKARWKSYLGKSVWVYGLSPVGNPQVLLGNSGELKAI